MNKICLESISLAGDYIANDRHFNDIISVNIKIHKNNNLFSHRYFAKIISHSFLEQNKKSEKSLKKYIILERYSATEVKKYINKIIKKCEDKTIDESFDILDKYLISEEEVFKGTS